MRFVNLTPHPVKLVDEGGKVIATFLSEGVARAVTTFTVVKTVEISGKSIDVKSMDFSDPEGLPAPREEVMLIVSRITAEAAKAAGRSTGDLLIPTDVARGDDGQVIGCRSFSTI